MPDLPETMLAAVYDGPRQIGVRRVPTPTVDADDVLVAVDYCGVCGSDLHFVIEGWGRPGTVHGHEWSGRIVDVGPKANGWSLGDRVVGGATK